MKTPIIDFVKEYTKKDPIRFHMPGHKGHLGLGKMDITEIDGADYLHLPTGIINESEQIATSLFESQRTIYSTFGSSACIKAMCYLAMLDNKKEKFKILATRNAHKAFIDASILLDFEIEWVEMKSYDNILSCDIDYKKLEKQMDDDVSAVYITSPDYLGNTLDVERICRMAREKGIISLVDNAHGSYLKFLEKSLHPLDLGCDMCCDSAHKTLVSLTGGAYLHIGQDADSKFAKNCKNALSIFSSTSPSYLILETLDLCNQYIEKLRPILKEKIAVIEETKQKLKSIGYGILDSDPLKITIDTKKYGYTGHEINEILKKRKIYCEYHDQDFVVLMANVYNHDFEFDYLVGILEKVEKKYQMKKLDVDYYMPIRKMSIKEASMRSYKEVALNDSLGKLCGYVNAICPPAILVVSPGEEINESVLKILRYYNVRTINIVDD